MAIDVETVYIDIEYFYLFKMAVRKEGKQASLWGQAQFVSGAVSHRSQGYTKTWRQFAFQACSNKRQIITDST